MDQNVASAQAFSSLRKRLSTSQSDYRDDNECNLNRNISLDDSIKICNEPENFLSKHNLNYPLLIEFFCRPKTAHLANNKNKFPRFTFYSEKTGIVRSHNLNSLDLNFDEFKPDYILHSGLFWIDIVAPTVRELNQISILFGLHPLTTEDIQTPGNQWLIRHQRKGTIVYQLFLCCYKDI
jgi:hypothetical protein